MMKSLFEVRLRAGFFATAGLAGVIGAVPALAQDASQVENDADVTGENATSIESTITVTGSRISRPNLDATVPIATITAEELVQTGQVNIGDRLALLPQFRPTFTTQNAGRFIGTAGLSILDLRGQGTARTLVLQNGLRHVTSSPGAQSVDISTIPVDLIQRVDIVTGGNSSVYGSDAVAGVVNFVLRRDFDGVRFRAQSGISSQGDGNNRVLALTAGRNFASGRGNIAVALEYSHNDPVFQSARPETGAYTGRRQFQLVENTAFSGPGGGPEPASGNGIPDTAFLDGIRSINFATGGLFTASCPNGIVGTAQGNLNCTGIVNPGNRNFQFGNTFVFLPDGQLVLNPVERDFRQFGSGNAQGGLGATFRETGLLQTGVTRYASNLLASFEVSEGFRPYLDAKFVRTEAVQEGQPTFFPGGGLNTTFSINNPFLTPQARGLLQASLGPATTFSMNRFNTDFAGRGEDHRRDLYRIVVGAEGSFFDTWKYNVAFNFGRMDGNYETRGNILVANFNRAINAVRNPAGDIVCAVNADANPANDDQACRPLNLFGLGAPSQEALAYIGHVSRREEWSEQRNAIATISGDFGRLFELPGGPIQFVVGGEYRSEDSFSAYDEITRSGQTFLNALQNFTPPTLKIWEAFGEVRVPILAAVPFFEELSIEGAARVSDYNVGSTGTVVSYNAGGVWSPVRGVRARANYGRAVRAPTMSDLFNPQNQTFLNGLQDPCGQQFINRTPQRAANCAARGVPTTQTFNGVTEPFTNIPGSGISGLSGGNPNLFAEKSDSLTAGVVVQPAFLPGFTMSVDWYRIELSDAINVVGAQTVINQCYDDPGGINNQFCAAVFRNPNGTFQGQAQVQHAGGVVTFPTTGASFIQGPFNFARQETSGVDLDMNYTTQIGENWRLGARAIVSWLAQRNLYTFITEPDRLTRERSVLGNPEWNGQLNVTVGYKGFDLLYAFRYLDRMTISNWRTQNSEQGRPPEDLDAFPRVFYPAVTYSDIRGTFRIENNHSVFFGVDNVFNRLPPFDLLGDTAGGAIYPNMGRFFYAGIQANF